MNRRLTTTLLATLVVGFVSMGTASAAPITVGELRWDDTPTFGSHFTVFNQAPAHLSGSFSNIVLTFFSDAAGSVALGTYAFSGTTLAPGQQVSTLDDLSFWLDFGTALAARLTLDFTPDTQGAGVQELVASIAGTCLAVDQERCLAVSDEERSGTSLITAVPEPASVLLLTAGLSGFALRRRRH